MRKIFVLPMLLAAGAAGASTTFYYDAGYDGTNGCPGWFLSPNATSCDQAVTKITTPRVSGRNFAGYYVNGTQIVDSSGNFIVDGSNATNLFNNSDPGARNPRHAEAGYSGGNNITVQIRQSWAGLESGWYSCGVYGFHMCTQGGNYYTPPAVNCWNTSSWPCDSNGQNCNYDYKFNSYLMADGKSFIKPSCDGGTGCWNNPYPTGLATGSVSLQGGCTPYYLGALDENNFSISKIYSFACKRIKSGSTWLDEYSVSHGKIKLNVDTAGECKYELVCDNGYAPAKSSTKVDSVKCIGNSCRGWFDGFVSTLTDFKNLNSSCVSSAIATN